MGVEASVRFVFRGKIIVENLSRRAGSGPVLRNNAPAAHNVCGKFRQERLIAIFTAKSVD